MFYIYCGILDDDCGGLKKGSCQIPNRIPGSLESLLELTRRCALCTPAKLRSRAC